MAQLETESTETHVYIVSHGRCSTNKCTRMKETPKNITVNFYAEQGTVLQNKNYPNFSKDDKYDWIGDSTDLLTRTQNGEIAPFEVVHPKQAFCDMVLTNEDDIQTFGVYGHETLSIPSGSKGVYLYELLRILDKEGKPVVVHVLACRQDGPRDPLVKRRKTVVGGKQKKRKTRRFKN